MPDKREAVIISAVRTPVGKFQGGLKDFSATDLGAMVVRESVMSFIPARLSVSIWQRRKGRLQTGTMGFGV